MSVISSIQNAAGNAFTSARVAVTRGVREEAQGLVDAALGREQQEAVQMSTIEQRARQAANFIKLGVTTYLKAIGWGVLTNKYVVGGALILIVIGTIAFFYISITYIGLFTMAEQDIGGTVSTIVDSGGCVLFSEKEDIVCGFELTNRLFGVGLERIGLGDILQKQACFQGAERVGEPTYDCT